MGKNAARESGLAKKNIVRNEGIEKKVPEHKDFMKKKSFLEEITPPPPPHQKLNGQPLSVALLYADQFPVITRI